MKKLLYLSTIALTLLACQKNEPDDLFGKNPSQRSQESQAALRQELTAAEHGWKLTYFTNQEKFGGFTFLMKFSPDGLVEMASDVSTTASATTSKYEIKQGQGTMLSFVTKNYIHELADSFTPSDLRGKGYEGEFEFIYYGKEGDKLKFRTQRKDNQQYLYFEPASSQDWNGLSNLSGSVSAIEGDPIRHYFKVTTGTSSETYTISLSHRYLTLTSLSDPNKVLKTGVVPTSKGFTFTPPLVLEGKTFSELPWDNNASPARYTNTIEGVTAEIRFARFPTAEQLNDDYAELNNISQLVILESLVKGSSTTSEMFYNNVFKIDDTKRFVRVNIGLFNNNICGVFITYNFNGTSANLYSVGRYSIREKRFFPGTFTGQFYSEKLALWQAPENAAIYAKAKSAIQSIFELGHNGLYVRNLHSKYFSYQTYMLQSRDYPIQFSALALPKQ